MKDDASIEIKHTSVKNRYIILACLLEKTVIRYSFDSNSDKW